MIDSSGLGGWADLPFFAETLPGIAAEVARETRPVLPPADTVFAALRLTPPEAVRVVILGQDPYPTPGHANGLAFSVAPGLRPLPKSLVNIYAELTSDLGLTRTDGDLRGWARQGVLLLNTVLTVPAGDAHGHKGLGWQALARQVVARVSRRPCAFLLWGRPAQAYARDITPGAHLVLAAPHPSPLSAYRGFFGARPFSQVNDWLTARGQDKIDWSA